MLQPRISPLLRRSLLSPHSICLHGYHRALRLPIPQLRQFSSAPTLRLPAQEPKDEEKDIFIPKPLGRPIGFPNPPQAGENTGARTKKTYTGTTMSERNLQKRKDIVEQWSQNYFRDFKNVRKYRSGKTFVANPRIFRKDLALYFPNFHGKTLAESKADTTPVLSGKVSVVKVYSSGWGEAQVGTFTAPAVNTELHELLGQNEDIAQQMDINIEENTMKAWVLALLQPRLRSVRKKEEWSRYFIVRKGVSDRTRETIGLLNGRVGYVYLVDQHCKIRWAGSGDAEGTEMGDLTRGFKRLIEEARVNGSRPPSKPQPSKQKPAETESGDEGVPIPVPIVF